MKIIDLVTLNSFFESQARSIPAIVDYVSLSNGEKAVDEISAFYTDQYKGLTAFFQVAEVIRKNQLITFQCSLTIATKPADVGAGARLGARDQTLKLMLELIGKLENASEGSLEDVEESGDMYDLIIEQIDRIFPIGLLANVNLEGHYVDIDVTVPVNHLLYPA